MTADPVTEFLKMARPTTVKAHVRKTEAGPVIVKAHTREEPDEKAPEQSREDAPQDAARAAKRAREEEMWRKWKEGGQRPEDLRPLLDSFAPMIRSKSNVYTGRVKMIPDSAIEAEFRIQFVNALRSYDPSKGSLGTYVYRYLDKAKRFIVSNQNVGRIPENRVYKIKAFNAAKESFMDEHGREPTVKELAAVLGWSESEADRMDSELRNDLLTQGFEEDPYALTPSKSEEVIRLFRYELEGRDREVYEHLVGLGRPRVASTGELAKIMGIPDYQVSRIKKSIQKRLQVYLTE